LGVTPDKRYVIVDCSEMNTTMSFVADQLVYMRNAFFSQGGQIHRGYLGAYGLKNQLDAPDLDMRNDGEKGEHSRILGECQNRIGEVTFF